MLFIIHLPYEFRNRGLSFEENANISNAVAHRIDKLINEIRESYPELMQDDIFPKFIDRLRTVSEISKQLDEEAMYTLKTSL